MRKKHAEPIVSAIVFTGPNIGVVKLPYEVLLGHHEALKIAKNRKEYGIARSVQGHDARLVVYGPDGTPEYSQSLLH